MLQCALLLGITHWGCSLKGPWVPMFFILLLVSFVGVAIGLTLSAMARTSEVAIALLPIILLPMIILGGSLRPVHKLPTPIRALSYLVPSRWAFEARCYWRLRNSPILSRPAAKPVRRRTNFGSHRERATKPNRQRHGRRLLSAQGKSLGRLCLDGRSLVAGIERDHGRARNTKIPRRASISNIKASVRP